MATKGEHIPQIIPCGCAIHQYRDNSYGITFCPKHKAAPERLKALRKAQEDINWMINNHQFLNPQVFEYIDKALVKVDEK